MARKFEAGLLFSLLNVCPIATRMYNAMDPEKNPVKPMATFDPQGRLMCSLENVEIDVRDVSYLKPDHSRAQISFRCTRCSVTGRFNGTATWDRPKQ